MPKQIEETKKQVGKVVKGKTIEKIQILNNGPMSELKSRRISRIAKSMDIYKDQHGNDNLYMSNQLFYNDITRPMEGGVFTKLQKFTQECLQRNYEIKKVKCYSKGTSVRGTQYFCYDIIFGFDLKYEGDFLSLKATLFTDRIQELKICEGSISILRHFALDPNEHAPLTLGKPISLYLTKLESEFLTSFEKGQSENMKDIIKKTEDIVKIEEEESLECPESPFVINDYGKEDSEFQIGGSSEPVKKVTLQEFKEAVNERTPLKDITQRTKTVIKRSFADDYDASGSN